MNHYVSDPWALPTAIQSHVYGVKTRTSLPTQWAVPSAMESQPFRLPQDAQTFLRIQFDIAR